MLSIGEAAGWAAGRGSRMRERATQSEPAKRGTGKPGAEMKQAKAKLAAQAKQAAEMAREARHAGQAQSEVRGVV